MLLNRKVAEEIKSLILSFVDDVLNRRIVEEPFDITEFSKDRPFHAALVPEEIWKASKFERSFVTSLGQIGWEKIARIIGEAKRGSAKNNYKISGDLHQGELTTIQKIIYELEHKVGKEVKRKPNWSKEKEEIDNSKKGEQVLVEVISDLYVESKDGSKLYIELKSSLPNADQSRISKEKMLKIYCLKRDETNEIYFALPDNPYRTKEDYNWPHPKRFFDMSDTNCVLMGKDFWDKLGGEDTYEELLVIFTEVGKITKKRIREEFLGI